MKALRKLLARAAAAATVVLAVTAVAVPAQAADAPGAPGGGSSWTAGGKQGFGTSVTTESKVWYTLGQGIVNEVYYPRLDVPNVQDLQYVVTDGSTFTDVEGVDTDQAVELPDAEALTQKQVNTDKQGRYRITKTYATDPDRPTLLVQTRFEVLSGGPLSLYVLYNPSLNNSGKGDTGATSGSRLVSSDGPVASALAASPAFTRLTTGYSGTASDPYTQLTTARSLPVTYDNAPSGGNIAQAARISVGTDTTFTLALGFGTDRGAASAAADASLAAGYPAVETAYADGWHAYLDSLEDRPASVTGDPQLEKQYNVSIMTIKAAEDKTYRGGFIASPSIPWGNWVNADNCCAHGYHAVWPRDLYHKASALIAAGDEEAAERALDYLFDKQQNGDGSFKQNTWLNGTQIWGASQKDQAAYPLILAWQLGRTDAATWAKVKKSADYLKNGSAWTPQERWEEEGGYSPSTIAAVIAGLVAAADIAGQNGDTSSKNAYLAKADDFQGNIENWTFTTTGKIGDGRYYMRINANENPDDGQHLEINNGGGTYDEREIVDAGFLELVRFGVKPADDACITGSLPEVDSTIKVNTPNGPGWYRYNHDGYGETADGKPYTTAGVGRLWPLLTGERGQYELARGNDARPYLATMAKMANDGYMLPEQVWDRADAHGFAFGEGTGSATPLTWAMAQFVRLAHSIDAGENVETPAIVSDRYADSASSCGAPGKGATFNAEVTTWHGQNVFVVGNVPALGGWNPAGAVPLSSADYPVWKGTRVLPGGTAIEYKYIKKNPDGKVEWEPGANRAFTTPADGQATRDDTWGQGGGGTVTAQFSADVTTWHGQNVFVIGNVPALGGWNPAGAVPLSSADYPTWRAAVQLPANTPIQYKYIKKNPDGAVTWICGGNRAFTSPGGGSVTRHDSWC